jgi:C-terminal processing protease CtpA/Prc
VSKDKHFRFGFRPYDRKSPEISPQKIEEQRKKEHEYWLEGLRMTNYGFQEVAVLPGNIGYLDFRRHQPPELAGDTLLAAMGFLANCDALIIDLRNCSGGNAYMNCYFSTFFFPEATKLYDMEFRGDNFTERFWTLDYLPGKKLVNVPLYILTSAYTFSGAEAFSYRFQSLKRATVVGEVTAGGANAGGVLDVPPFFRVYMPMGRPIEPLTKTNWEGTGVIPDIKTSALEALVAAQIEALQKMRAKSSDTEDQAALDRLIAIAQLEREGLKKERNDLAGFAGSYGPYEVYLEGGQLRLRAPNRRPLLLRQLSDRIFCSEAQMHVRLEFIMKSSGTAERLLINDEEGKSGSFAPKAKKI